MKGEMTGVSEDAAQCTFFDRNFVRLIPLGDFLAEGSRSFNLQDGSLQGPDCQDASMLASKNEQIRGCACFITLFGHR